MAKIGSLEVDTLHIPESAVTGSVVATSAGGSGNGSLQVTVPNPMNLPVQINAKGHGWGSANSTADVSVSFTVKRVRGPVTFYSKSVSWSFGISSNFGEEYFSALLLDTEAQDSDVYRIEYSAFGSGGPPNPTARVDDLELVALYVKKGAVN